jgi:hypothetical protein
MVLNKSDLIASLQNEVRILVHLTTKIDRSKLDYRPSAKQRSTLELLRYLSMMGPTIVRYGLASKPDMGIWTAAAQAAEARDYDQTLAAIAAQAEEYASLLGGVPDDAFLAEVTGFDGRKVSLGSFLVNFVLGGHAAYRTQLFLYLKANGREELGTANLWGGVDAPAATT